MRHELIIEGVAFRLRPVSDADASLMLGLRTNSDLIRYLHPIRPSLEDQLAWLNCYYERSNDYYFVVERKRDSSPEGLISLYEIDDESQSGEWGRWILSPRSLAAVESAWLIYRCAFETLGLQEIYCRTVAENISVVSFHDSCGITERKILPGQFKLNGKLVDAVEHRIERAKWMLLEPRLRNLAELTARRLHRV